MKSLTGADHLAFYLAIACTSVEFISMGDNGGNEKYNSKGEDPHRRTAV